MGVAEEELRELAGRGAAPDGEVCGGLGGLDTTCSSGERVNYLSRSRLVRISNLPSCTRTLYAERFSLEDPVSIALPCSYLAAADRACQTCPSPQEAVRQNSIF